MNILISGTIGTDTRAADILNQIETYKNEGVEAGPLNIHIMSPGGSVVEGLTIYNALKRVEANVYIDFAASIAATIAMSGKTITMAENGRLMIHDPLIGGMTGRSEELRKMADELDRAKDDIIRSFDRTGLSAEALSAMMDKETYLTAKEAKKLGFIDSIGEPSKMVACLVNTNNEDNIMLEKLKAIFGKDLDAELEAKANELEKVKAELAEKEAALKAEEADRAEAKAKAEVVAELLEAGKMTKAQAESTWLDTQTIESLKAYGETAPVVVAQAAKLPELADEPDEQIKSVNVGGVTVNKFNSVGK